MKFKIGDMLEGNISNSLVLFIVDNTDSSFKGILMKPGRLYTAKKYYYSERWISNLFYIKRKANANEVLELAAKTTNENARRDLKKLLKKLL